MECVLAGESRRGSLECPSGVIRDACVLAYLHLALAVWCRAFDVRHVPYCAAKHGFCLLAMRAPEGAIKDNTTTLEALCKRVELVWLGTCHEARTDPEYDNKKDDCPQNEYTALHMPRVYHSREGNGILARARGSVRTVGAFASVGTNEFVKIFITIVKGKLLPCFYRLQCVYKNTLSLLLCFAVGVA